MKLLISVGVDVDYTSPTGNFKVSDSTAAAVWAIVYKLAFED